MARLSKYSLKAVGTRVCLKLGKTKQLCRRLLGRRPTGIIAVQQSSWVEAFVPQPYSPFMSPASPGLAATEEPTIQHGTDAQEPLSLAPYMVPRDTTGETTQPPPRLSADAPQSPRLDPVAEMGSQSLTAIAAGSDCLASSMTQPRIDRRNLGEPWESLHSNPVHLDVLDMSAISTAPGSVFDEADPPSNLQECRIPGETEDQSLNSLAGEVESLKQRLAEVMRLREREREQERCHRRDEQIQKERLHKEQLDHEREINAQRLIEMAQLHDEALLQANRDHADNLAEAVSQVTRKLEMERQALHAEDLLSVEAYRKLWTAEVGRRTKQEKQLAMVRKELIAANGRLRESAGLC